MMLKDCPVGSVVRLVRFVGRDAYLDQWNSVDQLVQEDKDGNFVINGYGDKRYCKSIRYQFSIVRPAPEPTPEPRITFTVGGQEFYVGQRVWVKSAIEDRGMLLSPSEELEICAISRRQEWVVVRRISDMSAALIRPYNISTTPPTPHEWKRGDWARHKSGRECFVCGAARLHGVDGPVSLMVSFKGEVITNIPASEFTFIKHIDLPS